MIQRPPPLSRKDVVGDGFCFGDLPFMEMGNKASLFAFANKHCLHKNCLRLASSKEICNQKGKYAQSHGARKSQVVLQIADWNRIVLGKIIAPNERENKDQSRGSFSNRPKIGSVLTVLSDYFLGFLDAQKSGNTSPFR